MRMYCGEEGRSGTWKKVRGVCESMESHLQSSDFRSAYRGIRNLRSSRPPPRYSTVKAAEATTLMGGSKIRARWAGYFEELCRVENTDLEFPGDVDAIRDGDRTVSCDVPTLEKTRRAMNQLKVGNLQEASTLRCRCGYTFCGVPFGTSSSRPTGDGALFRSGRKSVTPRSVTTMGGYPPLCARQGPVTNSPQCPPTPTNSSPTCAVWFHNQGVYRRSHPGTPDALTDCPSDFRMGRWQSPWIFARRSTR